MTKQTKPPEGVKLINREKIAELTGCGLSKVVLLCLSKEHGFPAAAHTSAHRKKLYDEKEVLAWMKNNDLKKLPLTAKNNPRPDKGHEKKQPIDNKLAQLFIRNMAKQHGAINRIVL